MVCEIPGWALATSALQNINPRLSQENIAWFLGVVMANNTERTLCFGFQPWRVPDHQSSKRERCVGVVMVQGKETGLTHVGVKMEAPLQQPMPLGKLPTLRASVVLPVKGG